MKLPLFALTSFFLASCQIGDSGHKSVSHYSDGSYIRNTDKCSVWLSYHSECLKNIRSAKNAFELFSAEKEASDVRMALSLEARNSGHNVHDWLSKISVAGGEAMLAADARQSELKSMMLFELAQLREGSDYYMYYAMDGDNSTINSLNGFIAVAECMEVLEEISKECILLGLGKEYSELHEEFEYLKNMLISSSRPKSIRANSYFLEGLLWPNSH